MKRHRWLGDDLMVEAPNSLEPVTDLHWAPDRARQLGEEALTLWEDLLSRLRTLPVGRNATQVDVRRAVAREVPDEPLSISELMDYMRAVVLDQSMYPGQLNTAADLGATLDTELRPPHLQSAAHSPRDLDPTTAGQQSSGDS